MNLIPSYPHPQLEMVSFIAPTWEGRTICYPQRQPYTLSHALRTHTYQAE
jgi:hypothetical protein